MRTSHPPHGRRPRRRGGARHRARRRSPPRSSPRRASTPSSRPRSPATRPEARRCSSGVWLTMTDETGTHDVEGSPVYVRMTGPDGGSTVAARDAEPRPATTPPGSRCPRAASRRSRSGSDGSTSTALQPRRLHDRPGVDQREDGAGRPADRRAIAPVARASVPAPRAVAAGRARGGSHDHGHARRGAGRRRSPAARRGRARPGGRGRRDAGHRPPRPDRRRTRGCPAGRPGPDAFVQPGAPEEPEAAETALVRRAQAGDAAAYGELVTMHEAAAFRVAYLLLGSASDAEDAAQEGFVHAYLALARFRAGEPFRPWLLQVVGNEARNRRRALGPPGRACSTGRSRAVPRRRRHGRGAVPGARPARRGGPRRGPRGHRPAPRRGAAGRRLPLPDGALGGGDRGRAGDPARDGEVAAPPGARPAARGPVRHGPARRGHRDERGQGGRRGAAAATGRGDRRVAGDAGPASRGAGAHRGGGCRRRPASVARPVPIAPPGPAATARRGGARPARAARHRRRRRRPRVPPPGVRHRVRRAAAVRSRRPGVHRAAGSGSAVVPPTAGAQRNLGSPVPVSDAVVLDRPRVLAAGLDADARRRLRHRRAATGGSSPSPGAPGPGRRGSRRATSR